MRANVGPAVLPASLLPAGLSWISSKEKPARSGLAGKNAGPTTSDCRALPGRLGRGASQPLLKGFHVQIDHWRDVQGQKLRDHQSTYHCQPQRLARISSLPI